ncbi:MAG: hypothetical protein V1679_01290 [Candidatus Peregrinibacteria bacterium]
MLYRSFPLTKNYGRWNRGEDSGDLGTYNLDGDGERSGKDGKATDICLEIIRGGIIEVMRRTGVAEIRLEISSDTDGFVLEIIADTEEQVTATLAGVSHVRRIFEVRRS